VLFQNKRKLYVLRLLFLVCYLIALILIGVIYVYSIQNKLVFHPNNNKVAEEYLFNCENVSYVVTNGESQYYESG